MTSVYECGTPVKANDLGNKITGIKKKNYSCTHKMHLYMQGYHTT